VRSFLGFFLITIANAISITIAKRAENFLLFIFLLPDIANTVRPICVNKKPHLENSG
jgi:uncharacterized membrane protein